MSGPQRKEFIENALGVIGDRIHFTGHLSHDRLAPLLGSADVSLAPSVFPEAFGLVSIEALAAGAIPVATYQTGLRTPLDVVSAALDDPDIKGLKPGVNLTEALAGTLGAIFERYDTREPVFRSRLHEIAEREFSWKRVAERYLEWARS